VQYACLTLTNESSTLSGQTDGPISVGDSCVISVLSEGITTSILMNILGSLRASIRSLTRGHHISRNPLYIVLQTLRCSFRKVPLTSSGPSFIPSAPSFASLARHLKEEATIRIAQLGLRRQSSWRSQRPNNRSCQVW